MTKAELIDRIARSRDLPPDISKKLIGQILGVAFDELASYFARSRVTRSQSPRFTFPHFGTFTKKRRSARRGVNPRTLEPIQIEACNTIDFKVSRELRESMNPKAGGEATEAEGTAPAKGRKAAAKRKVAAKKKTTAKKVARKKAKTRAAVKPRRTSSRSVTAASAGGARSASAPVAGPSARRLTPRDDEAELSALMDEGGLFDDPEPGVELPSSPMQRVKGRRRTRSRGTG